MNRTKKVFVWGALLCALSVCSLWAESPTPPPARALKELFANAQLAAPDKRPASQDFTLPLTGGGTVTLSALKGKVVFLNFWATWCPPCRAEMPDIEAVYQSYKDKGIAFIAVNLQEKKSDVVSFLKKNGYTFPAALDSSGTVGMSYGAQSIPTTLLIDKQGRIAAAAIGGRQWNGAAMHAVFDALLAE
jgi:thiol-disulfide isomerase/thioredoxin